MLLVEELGGSPTGPPHGMGVAAGVTLRTEPVESVMLAAAASCPLSSRAIHEAYGAIVVNVTNGCRGRRSP